MFITARDLKGGKTNAKTKAEEERKKIKKKKDSTQI